MARLNKIQRQSTERILLFGVPGVGKTHAIGELAEAGYNVYYFDFENGKKTLFSLPNEAQANIEYFRVPDTAHVPKAAKFMMAMAKLNGKIRFCETHGDINCLVCKNKGGEYNEFDMASLGSNDVVVFESLTKISLSVMNTLLKESNREPDSKPTWDDYGRQGLIVESILAFFEQCNTNVVFTSHPMDVMKDEKYECTAPIAGTSARSANISKFFDHVILLRMEGVRRVMYSKPERLPKYRVKTRYNIDLTALPQPSLLPLFRFVMESDNDPERKQEAVYSAPSPAAPVTAATVPDKPATPSLATAGQGKITLSSLKSLGKKS